MEDAYWNHQSQLSQSAGLLNQPHPEYVPEMPQSGMPSADEVHHYLGRNDDGIGPQAVNTQSIGLADDVGVPRVMDTQSIGSAYDRYLQSGGGSIPALGVRDPLSLARGPKLARAGGGGSIPALGIRDPLPSARGPKLAPNRRRRPRETLTLPPGASNTLFIEGLPSDSTRREVAHIFRPFIGYKEVRLVKRDSKYPAEDPLILGFVDFINPECAATALRALQGYIMDEDGIHSTYLRLQFSKFPDRRFGGRGKR
ncbi:RNA-binding protein 1-like [Solanum verrucosum]|uniref:RNA-binding protein 1-like n=1 Tax=Solanum verrucosum TaxID=315347 RepID=UPI0020D08380|nr:RNA-binding protein 1-like [Solanum verrucosum]